MKKSSTLFLKVVISLVAFGAILALLWFPQTEGRAADLDLLNIYADPVILYMYLASVPFFVALFQAFKLLSLVDKNKIFSTAAVTAVKTIQYCALALVGFLVAALFYLRFMAQGDDAAGPTMLGALVIFASLVIATAAGVFQKLLQNAINLKSENDLTV